MIWEIKVGRILVSSVCVHVSSLICIMFLSCGMSASYHRPIPYLAYQNWPFVIDLTYFTKPVDPWPWCIQLIQAELSTSYFSQWVCSSYNFLSLYLIFSSNLWPCFSLFVLVSLVSFFSPNFFNSWWKCWPIESFGLRVRSSRLIS